MNSFWEAHRWFRIAFSALAVPVGLVLMWVSGQWTLSGAKRVLELPDTGGHGFQFLVFILLGTAVFLLSGATAAVNVCALAITSFFKSAISTLPNRYQTITRLAFGAAGIINLIAVIIAISLLFQVLLIRLLS